MPRLPERAPHSGKGNSGGAHMRDGGENAALAVIGDVVVRGPREIESHPFDVVEKCRRCGHDGAARRDRRAVVRQAHCCFEIEEAGVATANQLDKREILGLRERLQPSRQHDVANGDNAYLPPLRIINHARFSAGAGTSFHSRSAATLPFRIPAPDGLGGRIRWRGAPLRRRALSSARPALRSVSERSSKDEQSLVVHQFIGRRAMTSGTLGWIDEY